MSNPSIDSLKAQLKKLEDNPVASMLPKSSGWFSRKLLIAVLAMGVIIWLGRDSVNTVLSGIVWLGIAYLVTQALVDAVKEWQVGRVAVAKIEADARIKEAEITALAQDGIDAEDRATIDKIQKTSADAARG